MALDCSFLAQAPRTFEREMEEGLACDLVSMATVPEERGRNAFARLWWCCEIFDESSCESHLRAFFMAKEKGRE